MSAPVVTRHEIDDDRWGRQYGELRVWVRFPGYAGGAEHNGLVWKAVDAFVERLNAGRDGYDQLRTKDGYLHGHVNGCGPDEIMVTKGLK